MTIKVKLFWALGELVRILSGNSKLGSGNTIIFLANKNRNPNGFLSARGVRANHNFLLNDGPRPPAKTNKASEGYFWTEMDEVTVNLIPTRTRR